MDEEDADEEGNSVMTVDADDEDPPDFLAFICGKCLMNALNAERNFWTVGAMMPLGVINVLMCPGR